MPFAVENTFAEILEGLYLPWDPQGFPAPELMQLNTRLLNTLGLPDLTEAEAAQVFSGGAVPEHARTLAQAYAGHQFGGFSPQLGDGRALLLGEVVAPDGHRYDLQLKGSGRTPFSRGGDGLAAIGPVLREYLISEAMHRLGVPTTRVLAAVSTGQVIYRQTELPGAVLARVASSHLRVGTLQFFAARQDEESLRRLVDYTLNRHYPERADAENKALALLTAVAKAQGQLIAEWMLIGFIHGVMNTDNMTLSGETIDYGPCAFMEAYDPATVFSSIDRHGRYAYGNQPPIGQWNLARMGEALLTLLDADEEKAVVHVHTALKLYMDTLQGHLLGGYQRKLGLDASNPEALDVEGPLIADLLDWMKTHGQDYTLTFRRLAETLRADDAGAKAQRFAHGAFNNTAFRAWHTRWRAQLGDRPLAEVATAMDTVNPLYIPRNHLVEEALEAAEGGEMAPFRAMLDVLDEPYTERAEHSRYAEPAPDDFGPYQTFCGT